MEWCITMVFLSSDCTHQKMATHKESGMVTKESSTVQVTTDNMDGTAAAAAAVDDLPKSAPQDEDNPPKPCPPDAGLSASSTEQLIIENDRLKNKALVLSPCDDEDSTGEDVVASSASSAADQALLGKQDPRGAGEIPGFDIATSRQEAASTLTAGQLLLPPSVDTSEDPSNSGFEQPQGDSGSSTSDTGVASSDCAANCRDGHTQDPDLLTTKDAAMATGTVEPYDSACFSVARKQPQLPTGVHPTDVNPAGLQGASSQAAQKEPASPSDNQLDDGVTAVGALAEPQATASQKKRAEHICDYCLPVKQQAICRLRDRPEARRSPAHALGVASHDGEGPVINLRAARLRREADRWATSCLACRELSPEVFIWPCGHGILCRRCYMDPYFLGVPSCPVCSKPKEGLKFSDDMLNFIKRRSMR